jgi:hypothetical protein
VDRRATALASIGVIALSNTYGDGPAFSGRGYRAPSPYGFFRSVEAQYAQTLAGRRVDPATLGEGAALDRYWAQRAALGVDNAIGRAAARLGAAVNGRAVVSGDVLYAPALMPQGDDSAATRVLAFRVGDVVRANGVAVRIVALAKGTDGNPPAIRVASMDSQGRVVERMLDGAQQDAWAWHVGITPEFEEAQRTRLGQDTSSGPILGWGGSMFGERKVAPRPRRSAAN